MSEGYFAGDSEDGEQELSWGFLSFYICPQHAQGWCHLPASPLPGKGTPLLAREPLSILGFINYHDKFLFCFINLKQMPIII